MTILVGFITFFLILISSISVGLLLGGAMEVLEEYLEDYLETEEKEVE